jgi:hypothetical protein
MSRESINKINQYRQSFRQTFSLDDDSSASTLEKEDHPPITPVATSSPPPSSTLTPIPPSPTLSLPSSLTKQHSSKLSPHLSSNDISLNFIPQSNFRHWLETFFSHDHDLTSSSSSNSSSSEQFLQETIQEMESNYHDYDNLDFIVKKYDISRLIILKGSSSSHTLTVIPYAIDYLSRSLYSQKLKPLIYLALSLYETVETEYNDQQCALIYEDLCTQNHSTMKWLTSTKAKFTQPMMDSFISYLNSLVFHSVMVTNLVRLSSAALLNLLQLSHRLGLQLPSFGNVINRFEILFSRFQLSSGHGANLISIAQWIVTHSPIHTEPLAMEITKYFKKVLSCSSLFSSLTSPISFPSLSMIGQLLLNKLKDTTPSSRPHAVCNSSNSLSTSLPLPLPLLH